MESVKVKIARVAVKSPNINEETRDYYRGLADGWDGEINVLKAASSDTYNYGWGDGNSMKPDRKLGDHAIQSDGIEH